VIVIVMVMVMVMVMVIMMMAMVVVIMMMVFCGHVGSLLPRVRFSGSARLYAALRPPGGGSPPRVRPAWRVAVSCKPSYRRQVLGKPEGNGKTKLAFRAPRQATGRLWIVVSAPKKRLSRSISGGAEKFHPLV